MDKFKVILIVLIVSALVGIGFTSVIQNTYLKYNITDQNIVHLVDYEKNELNDSNAIGHVYFSGDDNTTIWIQLPKDSNVTSAKANLTSTLGHYRTYIDLSNEVVIPRGGCTNGTYFWVSENGGSSTQMLSYWMNGTYRSWNYSTGERGPRTCDANASYIFSAGVTDQDIVVMWSNGTISSEFNPDGQSINGLTLNDSSLNTGRIWYHTTTTGFNWTEIWVNGNGTNITFALKKWVSGDGDFSLSGDYFWLLRTSGDYQLLRRQFQNGTYANYQIELNGSLSSIWGLDSNSTDFWVTDTTEQRIHWFSFTESNVSVAWLEVGTFDQDGVKEWTEAGTFNSEVEVDLNFTAINNWLSTCTPDVNGNCNLPLLFHSDTQGTLQINNINITYTYNITNLIDWDWTSEWNGTSGLVSKNIYWNWSFPIAEEITIAGFYVANDTVSFVSFDETSETIYGASDKWVNTTNITVDTSTNLNTTNNHTYWDNYMDFAQVNITPASVSKTIIQLSSGTENYEIWSLGNENTTSCNLSGTGDLSDKVSFNRSDFYIDPNSYQLVKATFSSGVAGDFAGSIVPSCSYNSTVNDTSTVALTVLADTGPSGGGGGGSGVRIISTAEGRALCGDAVCDSELGESFINCPKDCAKSIEKLFQEEMGFILLIFLLIIIGSLGYLALTKSGKIMGN